MKKFKKDNKGFSLVELIVVIAIMAVLVGVLAPALLGNIEKSKESKDVQTLDAIAAAAQYALADPKGNAAAGSYASATDLSTVLGASGTNDFAKVLVEYLGSSSEPKLSSKAATVSGAKIQLQVDTANNKVTVTVAGAGTAKSSDVNFASGVTR